MRITVLGAGAMGGSVARLLARHDEVELRVVDADRARAESVVAAAGRGEAAGLPPDGLAPAAVQGSDAVAVCVPYRLNLDAMRAALGAGVPYVDLGGLFHMTRRQLELDGEFRDAGVPAVIGVGACPGLSNVMARLGAGRLDAVESVDIVDGSVDPDLAGFAVPYSAETILDELDMPAMVFADGQLREVPAGSGAIEYEFPDPVGRMEAVYTLHSEIATLPSSIPGVRDVRWRLALPTEVIGGFRLFIELGLASREPVPTSAGDVVPREVLAAVLGRLPRSEGPERDVEFLDVVVKGTQDGRAATFLGRSRFEPQPEGIGGGAFGTSIPIAVTARWLAEGRIPAGVHPPEAALAPEEFLAELEREGVRFDIRTE
jgi:saccharopine dehydrogenase-like NADP-dependent oxidoreductase